MKKKTNNYRLWAKKLCCFLLAFAMIFSNVNIVKAEGATVTTESELITKVNPYLKSYDVSDAGKLWTISSATRFVVDATDANIENERLAEVVKLINAEFVEKEISANPHAMVYATAATAADIFVKLVSVEDITSETDSEEAYKITINESGVLVEAASENAAMYALRTIQAMIITNNGLVYGTIVDYPDVAERRLHVDCGRKYFSKDWFIRQIRELSYLKMNAIQMQFAENLGFRIQCDTDPQIVSAEHLTKDEVKEILAEAKKYGVKVIPVLNTPGHVEHILKFHPEYGQVDTSGGHSTTALDVTNPEAVAYIYSLFDEYMELFKGCEDFHIGADEYMEYDRYPFTSLYRPVLDDYAVEKYGAGYTWRDTMSGYTNELAAYVYSKGFKPRIYNDGVYFNEGGNSQQKITMHDYIGVDYWSRVNWITGSPSLQTFINRGHKDIYNFNSSFFYYVLRNGVQSDGRPANSFDVKEQYKNIYNNWTPGNFSGGPIADNHECIRGTALGIWCDYPNIVTEDVVHTDIAKELRSLACKSWETSANSIMNYDNFAALTVELGNVAAYEKGSVLPEVGEFLAGEDLGKIVLKFVDEDGESLKADRIVYGMLDDAYSITPDAIYGYRFVEADKAVEGKFGKDEVVITLTYELYTDKEALQAAVADPKAENDYIPETYPSYEEALDAAKAVLADDKATQLETDAALATLTEAQAGLISIGRAALYVETKYPVSNAGYTSTTYNDYTAAVAEGQKVLTNAEATAEEVQAAKDAIAAKRTALAVPSDMVTATANKDTYSTYDYSTWKQISYPLSNMLDGDLSTKTWTGSNQEVGDWFLFTFAKPVALNSFRLQFPDNADYIYAANVEISADNSTWTKIGTIDNTTNPQLDLTFQAEGATVQYVRLTLTKEMPNWTQITEATFDYKVEGTDNAALVAAVAEAKELIEADYTVPSWKVFAAALAYAEAVVADEGATDGEINAAIAAVEACAAALESGSAVPTPDVTEEPQPTETPDDVTKVFDDVYKDWYTDYVQYVYDNGLMTGIKGTKHFAPNANITKAQVAQVLYNMEGQPAVTDKSVFTDLKDVYTGEWYANAVAWAYATGVVTGDTNAKKFFPNADVTREQLALMMFRYADYKEYDVTASSDLEGLKNAENVNNWALDGVKWAVGQGLISGVEKNGVKDLQPQGNASRAQVAAILQRFCEAY